MTVTAGALSQVSVTSTTASLLSAAATAGVGPYTYQWYRSTVSGFTPGAGTLISGATSLTLNDTGLIPNTQYYYVVVATDTGDSDATDASAELAVTTSVPVVNPNSFAQSEFLGVIDQRFPYNTLAVQIDASQATALYAGSAVKMFDSAGGVPKVVGCSANDDDCIGFINFDIKTVQFLAGSPAEISSNGNVLYLYSTGAVARGAQVTLDLSTNGGVRDIADADSGDEIVGWAYDKAASGGTLIRVVLECPYKGKVA